MIVSRSKRTSELQAAIKGLVAAFGGYAWRNSNQPRVTARGRCFFSDPSSFGSPDIIALMPGGKTLWIEVKVGNDRLSQSQLRFQNECEKRQHQYIVVRDTIDELQYILENGIWSKRL